MISIYHKSTQSAELLRSEKFVDFWIFFIKFFFKKKAKKLSSDKMTERFFSLSQLDVYSNDFQLTWWQMLAQRERERETNIESHLMRRCGMLKVGRRCFNWNFLSIFLGSSSSYPSLIERNFEFNEISDDAFIFVIGVTWKLPVIDKIQYFDVQLVCVCQRKVYILI